MTDQSRIYSQKVELPEPAAWRFTYGKAHSWSNWRTDKTDLARFKNGGWPIEYAYTADQVTKLVQEHMAKALEVAAKLCDEADKSTHPSDLADAICNLIGEVK